MPDREKARAADARFKTKHRDRLAAERRAKFPPGSPEALARSRRDTAKLNADPERHAKKLAYAREQQRQYRLRHPDRVKNAALKKNYGITLEDYDRMFAAQEGKCFVCRVDAALHVDHCSNSTLVRGLLCNNCNNGLGRFMHNPDFLRRAAAYLEAPPAFKVLA